MFELSDRVALVTGGSRGIGRAICVWLARQGAHVEVAFLKSQDGAAEVVAEIASTGGSAAACGLDVRQAEAAHEVVRRIKGERGRLDILVNCAGVSVDALLFQARREDFDLQVDTNLAGTINCCKAVLRPMLRAHYGRIVNVASVLGESGGRGAPVYAATKAAVIGLTKSLALEVGGHGITVNAVSPGFVPTDMTAGMPEQMAESIRERTPVGRMGSPEDVAAAVAFLASSEAGFVTGQVLRVNGGLYM